MDTAVFSDVRRRTGPAGCASTEGLFAEFEERVLAGEALPAFAYHPRRIDAGCGVVDAGGGLGPGAVAVRAVHRAWHVQIGRQRDSLVAVGHVASDGGSSALCGC